MTNQFRVRLVRIRIKHDWSPKISDHALLRFIERVDGIDVESARRRMQTDGLRRAVAVGLGSFRLGDVKLIIKDGRVITTLANNMRVKPETKRANAAAIAALKRPTHALTQKQRTIIEQMKMLQPIDDRTGTPT